MKREPGDRNNNDLCLMTVGDGVEAFLSKAAASEGRGRPCLACESGRAPAVVWADLVSCPSLEKKVCSMSENSSFCRRLMTVYAGK